MSSICERCLDSVLNFYNFKENLRRQIEPNEIKEEGDSKIFENVTELLEDLKKTEKPIVEQHQCHCLVTQSQFNPNLDGQRTMRGANSDNDVLTSIHITKTALPKKRGRKRKAELHSYPIHDYKRETRFGERSEPEPLPKVRKLCRLKLIEEDETWLKEQIAESRRSADSYSCSQCLKKLKSAHACRYHLINIHIKAKDPLKQWVSQKLRECEQIAGENGVLECVICLKHFNSSPALRYHLMLHAKHGHGYAWETRNLKTRRKSRDNKMKKNFVSLK